MLMVPYFALPLPLGVVPSLDEVTLDMTPDMVITPPRRLTSPTAERATPLISPAVRSL